MSKKAEYGVDARILRAAAEVLRRHQQRTASIPQENEYTDVFASNTSGHVNEAINVLDAGAEALQHEANNP